MKTGKQRSVKAGRATRIAAMLVCALSSAPLMEAHAQNGGGLQIFQQSCAVCHSLSPGVMGVAPSLFDIFGRKAAGRDFPYSAALKSKAEQGLVWNEATLKAWVLNPSSMVPGTSMGFAGLRSSEEADALVAFLKSNP